MTTNIRENRRLTAIRIAMAHAETLAWGEFDRTGPAKIYCMDTGDCAACGTAIEPGHNLVLGSRTQQFGIVTRWVHLDCRPYIWTALQRMLNVESNGRVVSHVGRVRMHGTRCYECHRQLHENELSFEERTLAGVDEQNPHIESHFLCDTCAREARR